MSALAQMFNPPTVRHIPSRLVISGRNVRSINKLPPLPDALSRQEAQKLVMEMKEKKGKAYKAEWDALNAERIKEYQKKKYQADRQDPKKVEETRKRCREYAQKNKEKLSAYSKKWYQANRDRVLAKEAEYRKRKNEESNARIEQE